MKDIAIFGAGGFGKEVACLIERVNEASELDEYKYRLIGFFDDGVAKDTQISVYGKVLGGMAELNAWPTPINVVIAIGAPKWVKKIHEGVTNPLVEWPNIISPDVVLLDAESLKMGKGNIVCTRCFFSCHVETGDFNIFNGYVTVGHDDKIGSYNSVMPAVRLSGEVTVGDGNYFGVGSIVLQGLKIGSHTTIGAGSVIMRKTKDSCTYVGNPAKKVEY